MSLLPDKPVAELKGLVLAGGKSTRMGHDKGLLNWHGTAQRYHLADLLSACCTSVLISCRPDQVHEIEKGYSALPDTFTGMGPFGGLLSAFEQSPSSAWLVVACDLPLLDQQNLEFLVSQRRSGLIATAFQSQDGLPEPLVSIWEPSAYPVLLDFLATGSSSLRKVLITNEINLVKPLSVAVLMNANTPEEAGKIKDSYFPDYL